MKLWQILIILRNYVIVSVKSYGIMRQLKSVKSFFKENDKRIIPKEIINLFHSSIMCIGMTAWMRIVL